MACWTTEGLWSSWTESEQETSKQTEQQYKPATQYQPGATNPADYISQHLNSHAAKTSEEEMIAKEYVNFITDDIIAKALRKEEVLEATLEDATLTSVQELQVTNMWYRVDHPSAFDLDVDIGAFIAFRKINQQLSITSDGLILKKKNKLVIPASLQQRALHLTYEGHRGLNKTQALLWEKVWFPDINAMAADPLASALPDKPTTIHGKENLFTWRNYQKVYVDFCKPPPSQQYLPGIVDEYSCVPEVEVVRSEAAATVTPVLDNLFSSWDIP